MSADEGPALTVLEDAVERARADTYGLLARLWAAPPDAALLGRIAQSGSGDGQAFLDAPWRALADALAAATPQAVADEYATLFLGIGKPEVFLCGSYYLAGFLHETPLVALRDELAELGLARDAASGETEDHVAFLCEVMRWLIAGDDVARCNLERQRRFWRARLQPWLERMCDAVEAHEAARVYAALAAFTRAFAKVETQALDMVE